MLRFRWAIVAEAAAVLSMCCVSGCGSGSSAITGSPNSTPPAPPAAFQGVVMAGFHAIAGASVQMYAASTVGYASASTALLSSPITTDDAGGFTVAASQYTCPSPSSQIYLVARGGNSNSGITFLTALGSCRSIAATDTFLLNEVTTVGFAWALAPFMSSSIAVGSSTTNALGLQNAFASAGTLADAFRGKSPSSKLDASLIVASAKVYSMANSLASCSISGSCAALFALTANGTSLPTNTADVALSIAQHPATNVSAIYNLGATNSPYAGLTAAPSDWTVTIESTGGDLDLPTGLALDSTGRAWVANYDGGLIAYSAQGVPVFPAPLTGNGLSEILAVAVDSNDNVWTGNQGTNTLTKFSSSGVILSGSSGYSSGIDDPYALEGDPSGNMWIVNYGNSSLVKISSGGTLLAGPLQGQTVFPTGIALDASAAPWITGQMASIGGGSRTHYSASGALLQSVGCCDQNSSGIAIDNNGALWVAELYGAEVDQLSATTGTLIGATNNEGGLFFPNGITLDGAGNAWLPNINGHSISEVAGSQTAAANTALSPSGGFGLDNSLRSPFAIGIDASGTVWLTSKLDNRLVRFIGVAVPVRTPVMGPSALP